jgi:hypothetical protein
MTLLVVGNHQTIDVQKIPWDKITEGVMFVRTVFGGTFDLKHRLEVFTNARHIPLYICFVIPPVEDVEPPDELLRGFGLIKSSEVILYDECIGTLQSEQSTQDQV